MAIVSFPTSIGGVSLPSGLASLASGPLSSLYQGAGVNTYNYPRDLATSPTKSHYVTFTIKDVVPAGYKSSNGTVPNSETKVAPLSNVSSLLPTSTAPTRDEFGELVYPASTSSTSALNQLTTGIGNALSYLNISQANLTISPKLTKPVGIVSLYMPDTLEANYNSSYTEMSLTADTGLLQTIRELNQATGDVGQALKAGSLMDAAKSLARSASSDPAVLDLLTKFVNRLGVDTGQLGSVLLKGQGFAINPQMQMIYQGISLREFNLSFTFTPKSATDSDTIDTILWLFKNYSLPTLTSTSSTSTDSLFLIPPAVFSVDFLINGAENKYLPKYGDCALLDVAVNYAPNGFAAFDNGAPVQTTLNLHFKEIAALDRSKIGSIGNRVGADILR
jgi:hypothetical protein